MQQNVSRFAQQYHNHTCAVHIYISVSSNIFVYAMVSSDIARAS